MRRGVKPKHKVAIKWSKNFAYALGLLSTDGNVAKDGRHLHFTSKDLEQVENFLKCFDISNPIRKKTRSTSKEKKYFLTQFSDVSFWNFLMSIGITPAKSKTLGRVLIPIQDI